MPAHIITQEIRITPHAISRLERLGDKIHLPNRYYQKGNHQKFSAKESRKEIIRAFKKGQEIISYTYDKGRGPIKIIVKKTTIGGAEVFLIAQLSNKRWVVTTIYNLEMFKESMERIWEGRSRKVLEVDYENASDEWQKIILQNYKPGA